MPFQHPLGPATSSPLSVAFPCSCRQPTHARALAEDRTGQHRPESHSRTHSLLTLSLARPYSVVVVVAAAASAADAVAVAAAAAADTSAAAAGPAAAVAVVVAVAAASSAPGAAAAAAATAAAQSLVAS